MTSNQNQNKEKFTADFPDRTASIGFFQQTIEKSIQNGNIDIANLNFAKLVESLRQQNINENGALEKDLEYAKNKYSEFRDFYNVDYPQQFLPPSERKKSSGDLSIRKSDKKLKDLISEIKNESHPDAKLLRKEYATSSRMPFKDFSGWIIEQLKIKDYNSIFSFMLEFYQATEDYEINDLKKNLIKFLSTDINSLFSSIDEQAIYEIQSFFILQAGVERKNREFWIGEDKESELLAKILSIYSFTPNKENFKPLINRANKFLRKMRKDVEYWNDYKNYNASDIPDNIHLEFQTDLEDKLKQLQPGERLYFFDSALGNTIKKYWNGDSSYKTRKFGINEIHSFNEFMKIEIFNVVNDIESIPEITSKGELKESAEKVGFEIKKSWTLAKIFENLKKTEEGKQFLTDFTNEKFVVSLKEEYKQDLTLLIENQKTIKRTVDLLAMV